MHKLLLKCNYRMPMSLCHWTAWVSVMCILIILSYSDVLFPCCKPSNIKISLFKFRKITTALLFSNMASLMTLHLITRPVSSIWILLPLMYQLDLYDILFFVNSFQNVTASFNIRNYVKLFQFSTRSSTNNKLQHVFSSTN